MSETLAATPYQDPRWTDLYDGPELAGRVYQPVGRGQLPQNVAYAALESASWGAEANLEARSHLSRFAGATAVRGAEAAADGTGRIAEGVAAYALALVGAKYELPPTPTRRSEFVLAA